MFKNIFAIAVLSIVLFSCHRNNIHEKKEWATIYKNNGIDSGGIEILDQSKERIFYYNKNWISKRMCPASTFKIFNSLVALESDVAPNEDMILKWDGIKRRDEWNKDMNMREAFKVSCVPYYQELARRIGKPEMQKWLDTVKYGNKIIGGKIDEFWLNNSLQITPDEQVGFLKKLYFDELPFSKRTQRIVRTLMLQEETPKYKLYYKTGTNDVTGKDNAWIVGFIEDSTMHPYFFANNIETTDTSMNLMKTRIKITKEIFQSMGILPK